MLNNDVFIDSQNRAWLSSDMNGGINMFDCPYWQDYGPYNQNLWNIPFSYTGTGGGTTEDSFGDIWIAYNGVAGGVARVIGGDVNNPAAWELWDNASSGLSLQFLNVIGADHSGNVYVGHDNSCGISKYNHATNLWTEISLYNGGNPICTFGQGLNKIRVDADNNVWFCGTFGLAKYDQTNVTFYNSTNTPLPPGNISDIAFDAFGNNWIGTEQGIYKYDGTTWTVYNSSNSGLLADWITSLLIDTNGTVWAGYADADFPDPAGLCSFDGTIWTQYTTANSGLQEKLVRDLELDAHGNIWVLSHGKGAAIFNPNGVIGYDCIDRTLEACVPLGVSEFEGNNNLSFSAYPNPVSTKTTIDLNSTDIKNVSISIFDGVGRLVKTIPTTNIPSGITKIEIDLSELSSGIYFCKIKTTENSHTIKLIKN